MRAFTFLTLAACLFISGSVEGAGRRCPAPCITLTNELTDRVADTEDRIQTMLKKFERMEDGIAEGGSVYTRWGRRDCPADNTLVYAGVTGGSLYNQAGGGTNYLCMPRDPQFNKTTKGRQSCGAFIYGTEYETCTNDPISSDDFKLHDHDVPCAVCETPRPNSLMIPARTTCPQGWMEEYQGYLMASHHGHQRTQFICVDQKPQANEYGYANSNGALLYASEARCGALPCPNYTEGFEMTCIVCTQ